MKVLIADDNANDALLIQTWLTNAGHSCTHVADGEAALQHLQNQHPDLIISDILMPKLDGFALCRAVKRDPAWRNIYFVFCTATYTDEPDAALALQLGAQRFLTKPVDFERLQALLLEIESSTAHPAVPAASSDLSQSDYLQLYNERLVSKLAENYRQTQTAVAELRRQNGQLWRLMEAAQVLYQASGETAVIQAIIRQAQELTHAEAVLFLTLEENDLVILQAVGRHSRLHGLVLLAENSVCAETLTRSQTTLLDASARQKISQELLMEACPGSCLLHPLPQSTAALLVLLHQQPDHFSANMVQTSRLWAEQAALAWENARLKAALKSQEEMMQLSQEELVHNARMATVGRLTAALAHEINNPLQSILGSVQFVLEEVDETWEKRPYLELAAIELDRVGDILQRMVGFYRRDTTQREPINISHLLHETLTLAEKQLQRHHIAVIFDLAEESPPIPIAANQFKQLFLNLILNAADAMSQGGQLEIRSQVICQRTSNPDTLAIEFIDNGSGIPASELGRIFDSFYTTKPQGTGLGLAISRDIARAHGGDLIVESQEGQGATFRLLLPCN